MENKLDKVMDRIRKLLALSNSSNPNEAATAAAKAAEMMAEYELEEADLRVESGEANSDQIEEDTWIENGTNTIRWKSILLSGIIKSFGCYTYLTKVMEQDTYRAACCVIGRRNNVRTAKYMSMYLTKELQNMANSAWAALPACEASFLHGKTWKNSFLLGAATTIYKRLMEQANANKALQFHSKGKELIRRDQAEVDAYYQRIYTQRGLRPTKSQPLRGNRSAYEQGQEAGQGVNLGGNACIGAAPRQIAGV